jgi:hypothetical protein
MSKVVWLVSTLLSSLVMVLGDEVPSITKEPFNHVHLHHYRGPDHHLMHLLNTTRSVHLSQALQFIESVQSPPNCNVKQYFALEFFGGGFCSQFQSLSSQFLHGLRVGDFHYPVLLGGHFRGYSENKFCDTYNGGWTCYFQQPSLCHKELSSKGRHLTLPANMRANNRNPPKLSEAVIPEQFRPLGAAFWWGVVQFYLFQPRPFVDAYLHTTALQSFRSSNGNLKVFPSHVPVAGLHIRHGDKKDDNWQLHSLSDALALVQKSKECQVKNKDNICFLTIDFYPSVDIYDNSQRVYNWLKQALRGYTTILQLTSVDSYQRGSKSQTISVPHSQLQNVIKTYGKSGTGLFPSTDVTIQQYNKQWVIPLEIFVASDDPLVLSEAAKQNLWYFSPGVSQSIGKNGMEKVLASAGEGSNIAVNATQEIIRDVYYLSQCSTLIGSASSQVFRMAVSLANVTGVLQHAAAVDKAQVAEVKRLSDHYGVPFPEDL